jgi:hypothetical protein
LDRPTADLRVIEEALERMASRVETEIAINVYLCRDREQALRDALRPASSVFFAGSRHWWPTPDGRLAKTLVKDGHRVTFLGVHHALHS